MRKVTSAAREYHVFCCLCLAIGICRSAFCADVPFILNYQGKLTDNLGNAVTIGNYEVQFRIWDDATLSNAQHLIWGRSFSVHVMSNGIFNILLNDNGAVVTSPGPPSVNSLRDAFNAPDRYLGMTITRTPSGPVPSPTEISPRQRLVSAPFAIRAQEATYAEIVGTAGSAVSAMEALPGYVAKASFPTLSDYPNSVLKWGAGTLPYKSRIVEYDSKCLVSANPVVTEPPAGVLWEVRFGAMQATGGKIIPAGGTTNGLEWPLGSGGDGDDNAWLRYFGNSSSGTAELAVGNDANDTVALKSSGDLRIATTGPNSTLLLRGQVKALGPPKYYYTTNIDEVAECDTFYMVYAPDEGFYNVTIYLAAGGSVGLTVNGARGNYGHSSVFPVAKGDRFVLTHNVGYYHVWRRQLGRASP